MKHIMKTAYDKHELFWSFGWIFSVSFIHTATVPLFYFKSYFVFLKAVAARAIILPGKLLKCRKTKVSNQILMSLIHGVDIKKT